MPKRRRYEDVDDVEKTFKQTCANLSGDGICLSPNSFVSDQIDQEGITKIDQKTLRAWLDSKGKKADRCLTT